MEVQHTSGGPGHVLGLGCWCRPIAYTPREPHTRVVATEEDAVRFREAVRWPYEVVVEGRNDARKGQH